MLSDKNTFVSTFPGNMVIIDAVRLSLCMPETALQKSRDGWM